MLKLLLKYIVGIILLALITGITLFLIANHFWQRSLIETVEAPNLSVFHSIQTRLMPYPTSDWPVIIKKLKPKDNSTRIDLLPLVSIHLPKKQMQILTAGKPVTIMSDTVYYFGYGLSMPSTYWQINHSDFVLKMSGIAMQSMVQAISGWMTHLMQLDLAETPKKDWPKKIKEMEKVYHLPLSLACPSDSALTATIRQLLTKDEVVLGPPNSSGDVEMIYIKLNHDSILKVGPIPYSIYPQNSQLILIGLFIVLVMLFVIIATILFSRNLDKIYQLTAEYSQGNFSYSVNMSKHSTLNTLYKNIMTMGAQIQNLMASQANLTRFVAHDCRTPVATMLFAINRLEKENLSFPAKQEINSLKEDLSDLNHLITDFLYYAKYQAKEMVVNTESVKINEWLAACVAKYQHSTEKNLRYFTEVTPNEKTVDFDPRLMKQALVNLIENAIKHANHTIQVAMKLDEQNNQLIISVEDDGINISDGDKERIFQPFMRLATQNGEHSGFGLGLAIALCIIQCHHGDLTVSDSQLGGACFTLKLPLIENDRAS